MARSLLRIGWILRFSGIESRKDSLVELKGGKVIPLDGLFALLQFFVLAHFELLLITSIGGKRRIIGGSFCRKSGKSGKK